MPGLAMTRSMGDGVAHSVGVTAEPETMQFTLGLNDKFLVIAKDKKYGNCNEKSFRSW